MWSELGRAERLVSQYRRVQYQDLGGKLASLPRLRVVMVYGVYRIPVHVQSPYWTISPIKSIKGPTWVDAVKQMHR